MFLKLFILSVLLAALALVALGIRLLLERNAEFPDNSCSLKEETLDECSECTMKDIFNCKKTEK
jgi:hypothetical protein